MLQLRIDIMGADLLWDSCNYGAFPEIESARVEAQIQRNNLFKKWMDGEIFDYRVDIVPMN